MPQISKRAVASEVRAEMFRSLSRALANISDEHSIGVVLSDILTPTERTMVAKRVMAAIFLDRGHSYRDISNLLKMSPTTVNTVHRELQKGGAGYRRVLSLFPKKSRIDKLIDAAERILQKSIPPVKGSRANFRRWKQS